MKTMKILPLILIILVAVAAACAPAPQSAPQPAPVQPIIIVMPAGSSSDGGVTMVAPTAPAQQIPTVSSGVSVDSVSAPVFEVQQPTMPPIPTAIPTAVPTNVPVLAQSNSVSASIVNVDGSSGTYELKSKLYYSLSVVTEGSVPSQCSVSGLPGDPAFDINPPVAHMFMPNVLGPATVTITCYFNEGSVTKTIAINVITQ